MCHIAYFHPEYVIPFDTPGAQFIDQVTGILISSLGIGVIFMLYFREYRKQQSLEYSQNVESAGRQLLFMINQFLDLSRIDMGKEEVFEENYDLRSLVDTLRKDDSSC